MSLEELTQDEAFAESFSVRAGTFIGLFDDNGQILVQDIGEPRAGGVVTSIPVITCRTSDVNGLNITAGDTVERIEGREMYIVKYELADGNGVSQLFLRR